QENPRRKLPEKTRHSPWTHWGTKGFGYPGGAGKSAVARVPSSISTKEGKDFSRRDVCSRLRVRSAFCPRAHSKSTIVEVWLMCPMYDSPYVEKPIVGTS